jgi:hypothetical protein
MNKDINKLKEKVNELFNEMAKISSDLLDGYYKEFTEIPTIKKHGIEIFVFKYYDSNDNGGEDFYPKLILIKTIHKPEETTQDKRKCKIIEEPNFISTYFEDQSLLDFMTDKLGIDKDLPNEDIENGEKLLTKISELIEFYSAEPWIEDTLDKTILPSKYDFS